MTVATGLAQAPSGRAAEGLMHAFVMSGLELVLVDPRANPTSSVSIRRMGGAHHPAAPLTRLRRMSVADE